MTRLSKPVATIETLKRLVSNSDSKYATKDSLSKVATTGNYSDLKGTPTSLKNPNAISFTGGSTASYDGSKSVSVAIPTSLPANGGNASTVNGHTVLSNVPANAKFTDTVYSLPDASTTTKGGVKVGSNITVDTGTISLTKDNVTGALGYTPPTHDTHYMTGLKVGATAYATSNAIASNGNVYLNVLDNYTVRDSHKIVGAGATTVTSDANGVITISSTDTNTVYTHPSTHPASMITGLAKVATSGSYVDLSNKPTIPTSLPANGGTATNANNIAITTTNPSSGVTYYLPFIDSSVSGNKAGRGNDGIRYYTREGTTEATGASELGLGNPAAAGTAGNKVGALYMYGSGKGYTELRTRNTSDTNYASYLPNKNGTIALTTDIPTSLPANGGNSSTVNGHTVNSDVPANAKFTDTVYSHPNSGVTAGTYKSVTVNAQGHVTAGTNPTTLSGYGITDAKIANGVITLGANSITPLTSHQSLSNYYTKGEVNSQISSIPKFAIAVVTDLPTANISNTTIYLKKTGSDTQNLYTEYIYVNSKWEQLGTQKLDLSGYLTKTDASNTYLGKYATAASATQDSDGNQINTTYVKKGTTTDLISHGNEFNFVTKDAPKYENDGRVYFNYRFSDGGTTNDILIKEYRFINGGGNRNSLAGISAASFNGYTINSSVPANAKFTDTVYYHPSTHPASMITGLATVATSGNYNDLINKPTIPTSLPANGGTATYATKLTVNAGSSTTPTYFYNGVPVACTGISVATVTATTTLNIPGGKIWIE